MKDQNNNEKADVMTADQLPQPDNTEPKTKKQFVLVRAYNWANRKFLQFKATKFGGFVVKGGKVAEGALALYGLCKLVDNKVKSKPSEEPEEEAVITCGEIVDDLETETTEEPASNEEVTETEHD